MSNTDAGSNSLDSDYNTFIMGIEKWSLDRY